MNISAKIKNSFQKNDITVTTNGDEKKLDIPGKAVGFGSSINGGELLFLSLATCFCNDIYREAARRKMEVSLVEIIVSGEFGKEGEPASNIEYAVNVEAPGSTQHDIDELIYHVDKIAEIHNTLRRGARVSLKM
ncbi:MAG TPA: OsmC family protein [Ohtaekwangia sp.]